MPKRNQRMNRMRDTNALESELAAARTKTQAHLEELGV